jgi:hypothetical protein
VGSIKIAFVGYSSSKKVLLAPDIVEYNPGTNKPMYDLIIGKQTIHDLGGGISLICSSNRAF